MWVEKMFSVPCLYSTVIMSVHTSRSSAQYSLNKFGQLFGLFIRLIRLWTHFLLKFCSLIQNNIGLNYGDGLNFVTCEHFFIHFSNIGLSLCRHKFFALKRMKTVLLCTYWTLFRSHRVCTRRLADTGSLRVTSSRLSCQTDRCGSLSVAPSSSRRTSGRQRSGTPP